MSRTSHPLFFLGKVVYYIGILLLFNFFFGLLFFRFLIWLIAGGVLVALLLGAMMLGKNMLFGTRKKQSADFNTTDNVRRKTTSASSDVIDVEAVVFEDDK